MVLDCGPPVDFCKSGFLDGYVHQTVQFVVSWLAIELTIYLFCYYD